MDAANDLATGGKQADPYADMRNSKPWLEEIKDAEKCFAEYQDKCDNIDKQYADLKRMSGENAEREMQIFWANLEVLKPSIYARPPVPVVASRFKDRKPLNRHASEITERSLVTSFDMQDIDETMKAIRDDLATNARGVMWLRFEEGDTGYQAVGYDHVDRKDFVHDPARKWKEVGWAARRSWLNMERMRKRFEETSGDAYLKATYEEKKGKDQDYSGEKKACVWEMWHKDKGLVVWVTPGVDTVLDIRPPYLQLDRFFPCPRPAYGTVERGTLKPVPDFVYYKDQIEEINELTGRISALSESLRMKGFYSAGGEDVAEAIETAIKQNDNQAILIPVPNVAAFGGGGTFKDSIIWMPVEQVAAVIAQLIQLRKQLIDDVYQITGLSDIMRGATDPNETLGAQELKSQYGNVRIRDRQEEMVRMGRDAARIAGEIMAENFSMETLMEMSQYDEIMTNAQVQQQIMGIKQKIMQAAQDPQMVAQAQQKPEMAQQMLQQANQQMQELQQSITWEKVMEFLRNQRMRPFALDIETDSTIQPDENAAKQRVTEFLTAMAPLIQQLGAMVAADPASANFAGEVLKFAASPFRAGRALEAAIDELVDQMKQKASQPKTDPAAEQAKGEMQIKMQELQLKNNEMQMKAQESQASMQVELQQARAELEKTNAEIKKVYAEIERINKQSEAAVITAQAKASQPERAVQ